MRRYNHQPSQIIAYRQNARRGNQYRLILPEEIQTLRPRISLTSVSSPNTADSSSRRATQSPAEPPDSPRTIGKAKAKSRFRITQGNARIFNIDESVTRYQSLNRSGENSQQNQEDQDDHQQDCPVAGDDSPQRLSARARFNVGPHTSVARGRPFGDPGDLGLHLVNIAPDCRGSFSVSAPEPEQNTEEISFQCIRSWRVQG